MQLQDKTALITGGTSGIGLETAKLFMREGARVAITGQNDERLHTAKAELGPKALVIKSDARSAADAEATASQVRGEFGGLDIVFANAGTAAPAAFDAVDEKHFDLIFDTNVKGLFFAVQKLAPFIRKGGSIILNTSWLNEVGTAGLSVISASKAAVRSFTRTLAAEFAPRGIRVNAVSPGPISTPLYGKMGLSAEQLQAMAGQIQSQVPMGRFGQPGEIAKAVLFLASDESSYVLGAELVVDGGLSQL